VSRFKWILALTVSVEKALAYFATPPEEMVSLFGRYCEESGLVPSAVLTQRVALVAARRISRAASFSCTSIEAVLDDN